MYTVITTVERVLREGIHTKTNELQRLYNRHTLTGDTLWVAPQDDPAVHQKMGDQWVHITEVDGMHVTSRWLAIIDNGVRYNGQLTESMSTIPVNPQVPVTGTRPHHVVYGETLTGLAQTYGTIVAKIVADNKPKYPEINNPVGNNKDGLIRVGWDLMV